ncbi:MAG: hypothetical protein Q9163_000804 [Psora crenata]
MPSVTSQTSPSSAVAAEHREEDDYMSMTIAEPTPTTKTETYTQRRIRKQREAEARAHPKSKAALALEAEKARETALATALPSDNKGAKMMAKLGYKPGMALGAPAAPSPSPSFFSSSSSSLHFHNKHAITEPIALEVKEGRGGIGALSERKRKFRLEVEEQGWDRDREQDQGRGGSMDGGSSTTFRERVAKEREEKRLEGLWWAGMKVLEGMVVVEEVASATQQQQQQRNHHGELLFRPLLRRRIEEERERRRRADHLQSLSRDAAYNEDPEEERQDRMLAFGTEVVELEEGEGEGGPAHVDEEFEAYLARDVKERLDLVLRELREQWCYCFWCKFRYTDQDHMQRECPGQEEEEHG